MSWCYFAGGPTMHAKPGSRCNARSEDRSLERLGDLSRLARTQPLPVTGRASLRRGVLLVEGVTVQARHCMLGDGFAPRGADRVDHPLAAYDSRLVFDAATLDARPSKWCRWRPSSAVPTWSVLEVALHDGEQPLQLRRCGRRGLVLKENDGKDEVALTADHCFPGARCIFDP